MKKPNNKIRGVKAWIGLVDDKLHFYGAENYYMGTIHGDIFKSKKAAKTCYAYVIPVLITPLPKRRSLKTK